MVSRMMRVPPLAQCPKAHQVVGGKPHQCLAREFGLADEFGLGQTTNRLHPAKGLFNTLAHFQAGLVTRVALGAPINGRVLRLGRHMRGHFELAAASHECLAVVTLVGPHRGALVLARACARAS